MRWTVQFELSRSGRKLSLLGKDQVGSGTKIALRPTLLDGIGINLSSIPVMNYN